MPHDHNPEGDEPLSSPQDHRAPRNPREDQSVLGKTRHDGSAESPAVREEEVVETADD
jgi:hypothetical protein